MFAINEPVYYLARFGLLSLLFTKCTWAPRALENVFAVGLGIAASGWWLPWLNKMLARRQDSACR